MKRLSQMTAELQEKHKETAEMIAAALIQKSSLEPDLEFDVGPVRIRAVLPTQEMFESASIDGYRDAAGQPLDIVTREPRIQRLLLSKVVKQLHEEVEFEIGDDEDDMLKTMIFLKLPRIMMEHMWNGFMAQRNALFVALSQKVGEAIKKSPASPSGEHDGDSSVPKEESPSQKKDSPPSTPPS